MEDKEINALIEKKILEAKLEVADKRFNTLVILAGVFLSVFTIIVPIWQMSKSADEVDKAIEKTEKVNEEMKNYAERINSLINDIGNTSLKVQEKYNEKAENISKDIEHKFDKANENNQKELAVFSDKIEKRIDNALGEATKTTKLEIRFGDDLLNGKEVQMNLKEWSELDLSKISLINTGDKIIRNVKYILSFNKVVDGFDAFSPMKGFTKSVTGNMLLELVRGVPVNNLFADHRFVMHNDETAMECELRIFYEDYYEETARFNIKHKE